MTIDGMEYLARRLANQTFVRYWKWWNYPCYPEKMALAIMDCDINLGKELMSMGMWVHSLEDGITTFLVDRE